MAAQSSILIRLYLLGSFRHERESKLIDLPLRAVISPTWKRIQYSRRLEGRSCQNYDYGLLDLLQLMAEVAEEMSLSAAEEP